MSEVSDRRPSARERLLAAGDELFYHHGVHSTGIEKVIERAGVAKGSLYYNFGGKDQLVEAYLDARREAWMARLTTATTGIDDPAARILAIFDAIGEYVSSPGFRGSEFANAAAEAADDGPERRAADRFRTSLREFFVARATETGAADPARLAEQLVVLHDGALATAQLDNGAGDAVATARLMASLALNAAGVAAPTDPD